MSRSSAEKLIGVGRMIAEENAYGINESDPAIMKSCKEDLKGYGFLEKCLENKGDLVEQLAQQKALLDEAVKVIEFYGDRDSWVSGTAVFNSKINSDDIEECDCKCNTLGFKFAGGKRARAFLEKVKDV